MGTSARKEPDIRLVKPYVSKTQVYEYKRIKDGLMSHTSKQYVKREYTERVLAAITGFHRQRRKVSGCPRLKTGYLWVFGKGKRSTGHPERFLPSE